MSRELDAKKIECLRDIVAIQCSDGNWNYDPYMHGMANGLILALATIADIEPSYLEAPDVWIKDLPGPGEPVGEAKNIDVSKWEKE